MFLWKIEQKWSFTGLFQWWTDAPPCLAVAWRCILSAQLLTFYHWATAISNICRRSASALAKPLTRGGFLCSRQINTICWWPDVHQRLPASEWVPVGGSEDGVGEWGRRVWSEGGKKQTLESFHKQICIKLRQKKNFCCRRKLCN